jgi:N-methylhydantoinase A
VVVEQTNEFFPFLAKAQPLVPTIAFRIGIDIGGTFTDAIVLDGAGNTRLFKVSSTPEDLSIGVMETLDKAARSCGLTMQEFLGQTEMIVHGTTVATNTFLQFKGAKTGLICTKGFRDHLEMRRAIHESNYDIRLPPPIQIVPRYLRMVVEERVNCEGEVAVPLNEKDVYNAIEKFKEHGVESIGVCFLFSFLNPDHEKRVKEIVTREYPGAYLSVSSEILPVVREYVRTSTTVINSYVGPVLSKYLRNLENSLVRAGCRRKMLVMQSNGGIMSVDIACERAVYALLSGLAAGPVASVHYAGLADLQDVLYVEMGGTSFEVCLIKGRVPATTSENVVARYDIGIPTVDINTIGAGGGSIAWIGPGGMLNVGPQSAGAEPGPACYGKGGKNPTVTDADLILGYLNPNYFLGGEIKLNRKLAEDAIEEKIAKELDLDLIEAAHGIFNVINSRMVDGIGTVSVERGHDPRDFAIVAAGGAGPTHIGRLAADLGSPRVIVPRLSSGFDALGMLLSDLRHDYVRTYARRTPRAVVTEINDLYKEMENEGARTLEKEGASAPIFSRSMDMRYIRQTHEVEVNVPTGDLTKEDLMSIVELFHQKHDALYAYCERDNETEMVNLRVTAVVKTPKFTLKKQPYGGGDPSKALKAQRKVFFAEYDGLAETPVYDPDKLMCGNVIEGPAIIEEVTTTVVIYPRFRAEVDAYGNYSIKVPI